MRLGPIYIADPLLGVPGGPRYYGLSFWGFQIGRWERPRAYALRFKRAGGPVDLDEALVQLIAEFKQRAASAHAEAAKLGYKYTTNKAICNTEAAVYLKCAKRLEEEHARRKALREFKEPDNLPPGSKGEPA